MEESQNCRSPLAIVWHWTEFKFEPDFHRSIFFHGGKIMKMSHLSDSKSNLAAVSVLGAFCCFLWLPLLPVLIPTVTVALGLRWIALALFSKLAGNNSRSSLRQFYNPTTPISQSQAQNMIAWPSLAGLPYPAGADSLPFSFRSSVDSKSQKRQRREFRQIARGMRGLNLRKPATNY